VAADAADNRTEDPMKLTTTQRTLLSTALQRDDGTLKLPASLKGGAAQKLVGKLLADGLVEEIPARGSMPVWRRDDEQNPTALRITQAGLAAIQAGGTDAGQQTKKARPVGRSSSTNKKKAPAKPKQTANPQSSAASLRAVARPNRTG
jgi:hypothetical protein